jgi:uncharacterized protein|uniref:membrane protein insertion efficiency factor YidD n=1 Tax=Halomonas sp. TaxID=1486246 RepID=UPI002629FC0A|nr:membrane protein insertion efficiency factor YidD [Halomonas sp.]
MCSEKRTDAAFGAQASLLWRCLALPAVVLIKAYQLLISPILGPRCRYWPSCSHYGKEAIQVHGPLKGGWLTFTRIMRCRPGGGSGIDPVPGGPSEAMCREDPELDAQFRPIAPSVAPEPQQQSDRTGDK